MNVEIITGFTVLLTKEGGIDCVPSIPGVDLKREPELEDIIRMCGHVETEAILRLTKDKASKEGCRCEKDC